MSMQGPTDHIMDPPMTESEAAIHNAALEEAAQLARTYFIGIFTGWTGYTFDSLITLDEAEDVASECGPICADAILNLKIKG